MRRTVVVCLLVCTALAAPPRNSDTEIRAKRAHLGAVVKELAARSTGHLDAGQRARRAALVESLRAYAERGDFPVNTKLPRYALPYFVDAFGTRCALAYAIDRSGHGAIIERLAARANHAYVAHLGHDRELGAWLVGHGLTPDEAAYIQAPGIIDDPADGGDGWEPPGGEPAPEDTPAPTTPDPGHATPPSTPPPSTPAPGTPTARTRPGGFDAGSWEQWWRFNRDAFLNLRERYHAGATTTGRQTRARRPDRALLRGTLMPFLTAMAAHEDEVKATALMAAALAAEKGAGATVVAGTLEYLRSPESRYRTLMVLALGLARDPGGVQALREILHDTKAGRRIFGKQAALNEETRAFAAVALGQSADASAVDDLVEVLQTKRGRREDLRAAAIASLAELAGGRDDVADLLETELKRARWTDPVLAAIPAALVKLGRPDAVLETVQRFRGPRAVRESCALALGQAAFDGATVDALLAAARRDPDRQARRYAAIAVGELCLRAGADTPAKLVRKLKRFSPGPPDGHFKQPGAMEWHLLSAGLFARRFADADIVKRLARVVARGGRRSERAAAAIALGLSDQPDARDALAPVFGKAKDALLKGCAAEGLGMLRDRGARDRLLELATSDPSGAVRYQAALGLGYLADGSVTDPLVSALAASRSGPARAALTRVLGQIGDRRAVDGLIAIAKDESKPRATRERAVGALGLLARDADRGWTFGIRRGFNFNRATPVMRRVIGIF